MKTIEYKKTRQAPAIIIRLMASFALSSVLAVGTAFAQYAGPASSSGKAQRLTEAGLYGFGLLVLIGLVVLLYVYAPRFKRRRK